jgi:hypothetical protein
MICILGDKDGVPTGVPYLPQQRQQESSNYGHFDLKSNIRLIDEIPEVKDRAEMRPLIEELNSENSFFRSVGCDAWDLENQPRTGIWTSRGYVQVCFEILELNRGQEWDSLFGLINRFDANLTAIDEIGVDLWRKPISFRGDTKLRTSAVIDLFGFGRSMKQSRTNFQWTATIIQAFFGAESERCLPILARPARKICDLFPVNPA